MISKALSRSMSVGALLALSILPMSAQALDVLTPGIFSRIEGDATRAKVTARGATKTIAEHLSATQPINATVGQDATSPVEVRPFSILYKDGRSIRSVYQYGNGVKNTMGVYSEGWGSLYETHLTDGGTTWSKPFTFDITGPAPPAGIGLINHYTKNTGAASGIGANFVYQSRAPGDGKFDVGRQNLAIFEPVAYPADKLKHLDEHFNAVLTPNDYSNATPGRWSAVVAEWNIVNRGRDTGFMRDRAGGPSNSGGLLMVPEGEVFGYGGNGRNVTFAYTLSRSGGAYPHNGGKPIKFYTGYMMEPNSIVGGTGRGAYWTGATTDDLTDRPYAPLQIDGGWLHGFDTTLANFSDNTALRLKAGQEIAWVSDAGTKLGGLTVTAGGVPTFSDGAGNQRPVLSGAWTAYAPTVTTNGGSDVAPSVVSASYEQVGKTLRLRFTLAFTASRAPIGFFVALPNGLQLQGAQSGTAFSVGSFAPYSVSANDGASKVAVYNFGSDLGRSNTISANMTVEVR